MTAKAERAQIPREETLDIVREIMAQVLQIDSAIIDLDTSLIDLGVDSLALIDARLLLEERLGFKLGLRVLAEDLTTMGKLVAYLDVQRNEHAPAETPAKAPVESKETPQTEVIPAASPVTAPGQAPGPLQAVLLRQLQLIEQQVLFIQTMAASAPQEAPVAPPPAERSSWEPPQNAHLPRTVELHLQKRGAALAASLPKSALWAAAPKHLLRQSATELQIVGLPFPLTLRPAGAGRRQDLDGNHYIDLTPAHSFADPESALVEQAEQVASSLCARVGAASVIFFASGRRALEQASQAARKATARDGIVRLRFLSVAELGQRIASGYRPAAVWVEEHLFSAEDLAEASRLAASCAALVILDRSATGLSNGAPGDLTVFSESLSGGLPFGAVVGAQSLLEHVAGEGAELGSTTCDAVLKGLQAKGAAAADPVSVSLEGLLRHEGLPLHVLGHGTGVFLLEAPAPSTPEQAALPDLLRIILLSKRILLPAGPARAQLHAAEQAALFAALREAGEELRHAGLLPPRPAQPDARRPVEKVLPVSAAQREYWAASTLAGEAGSANHITTAVHFRGMLDLAALKTTLQTVANRHESLRASFSVDGLTQTIAARVEVECPVSDARAEEAADPLLWIHQQAARPFALGTAPLLRAAILRIASDSAYLVLVVHHLVADGWSVQVIMGELVEFYSSLTRGRHPQMGKPHQLTDYLEWLEKQKHTADQTNAFWLRQIADPIEPLGLQHARRALGSSASTGGSHLLVLDSAIRQQLLDLSRKAGGSFFGTLLAGLSATLSRFSGREDIAIGIASAGQSVSAMRSLVGYCLSQLLLRFTLPGTTTVLQHLQQTRTRVLEAQEHRNYSARDLAREAKLSSNPLANLEVAFNLNRHLSQGGPSGSLHAELVKVPVRAVPFPLNVMAVDDGKNVRVDFQYATELFEPHMIHRLAEGFRRILEAFIAGPERLVWDLECFDCADLPSREHCEGEQQAWEGPGSAIGLFEEQVIRHGAAIALESKEESLSYAELQTRVDALARLLRARGVGPEKLVAIYQGRGTTMVVSCLAVWKAGGAYVALDLRWPAARIETILQQTRPTVILTHESWTERFDRKWKEFFLQPTTAAPPPPLESLTPLPSVTPENLAYVLYTSGSTGTPKGVMITHRSLLNYVHHVRSSYGQPHGYWGTSLVSSPLVFDLTVTSMIAPLCAGGRVRLLREDSELERLETELRAGDYNLVKLTPSHLRALAALGPQDLVRSGSVWVVGGEALSWELVRALAGARVVNEYGPTETTVGSSTYLPVWEPACTGSVPIGRPIANTHLRVLDHALRLLPIDVEGELYIAGAGLARGYLGQPDWTAASFLPDPQGQPGARMYRTGDRARWRADGQLEYLGRADEQVKVRGYRIELGEIESQLMRHPAVAQAVVVARAGEGSDQHLVAYYTAASEAQSQGAIPADELRSYLAATLPDYMLPSGFVHLDALPLTRNGKVDRKALPVPGTLLQQAPYAAPRTPLEARLCDIWSDVLGVERVGLNDDFFALGGDSIVLIEMIARARAAQIDLRTGHLTAGANLRAISEKLGPNVALVEDQIAPEGLATLTPVQRWFFDLPLSERGHWNQAVLLEVRVPQSEQTMRRALQRVVQQHDALRWRFQQSAEGWRALPGDAVPETIYERVDLSGLALASCAGRITVLSTTVQASLDLAQQPLFRAVEFVMPAGEPNRLLLVAHHLVIDGVSWRAVLTHLYLALRQAAAGAKTIDLGPRTTAAAVWAQRLEQYAADSAELRAQLPFWLAQTATPRERLPRDFPGELATVATEHTLEVDLSAEETTLLLRHLPEVYKTQILEVLVTALCLAMRHWTGAGALLLQLEGHGRERLFDDVDLSRTAGWFTSLFPLRVETASGDSPVATLLAVQAQLQQVPMRGLGYGLLRYGGGDPAAREMLAQQAEPEICLNYLGQFDQLRASQELLVRAAESPGPMRSPRDPRTQVLLVEALVLNGCLRTSFTFSGQMHREETIATLADQYTGLLKLLIEDRSATAPTYTASDFPLAELSDQDMEEVLRQMAV